MVSLTLNDKEKAVVAVLVAVRGKKSPEEGAMSLAEIAVRAFKKKGSSYKTKGNSWVRNSLRKPLRLGLVGHQGNRSGCYFATGVKLADLVERAKAAAGVKA